MKNIFSLFLFALLFVACDGDSSTSADNSNDEENTSKYSDSSVKYSAGVASPTSSSGKAAGTIEVAVGSKTVDVTVGSMTDHRDGQTYKTVMIGEPTSDFWRRPQVWMAQNLNYETPDSYCYNDDDANCSKYGRIYKWTGAIDSLFLFRTTGEKCGFDSHCSLKYPVQGACPNGWHLPTFQEWQTLLATVGGDSTAGKVLKSTSGWSNVNGADAFLFSALPAGGCDGNKYCDGEGEETVFWSSSEHGTYVASTVLFGSRFDYVREYTALKYYGYSVRCLKNDDSEQTAESSSSESAKSSNSAMSSSSVVSIDVVSPAEVTVGSMTDSRDSQEYKTVTIGTQTWMAQNLNYKAAISWCGGGREMNEGDCSKYGRLYMWAGAMDSVGTWSRNARGCGYTKTCSPKYPVQGVCPNGWHLPSQTEWDTLFAAVGGPETASKILKSTSGWSVRGNGTDAYSFSVLPAGIRYYLGLFDYVGSCAYFWSSTEDGSDSAYYISLFEGYGNANRGYYNKFNSLSVRCVQD